jgi:hypothetical protein
VGLFVLASRSDEGTSSLANRPPVAQGATAPRPRKQPGPAIERIVVRGGKPLSGVKRLEYKKGERVRFSVRSDAADEVHVHGFDVTKALPANRNVRFTFPADIEGVFEVELHGTPRSRS